MHREDYVQGLNMCEMEALGNLQQLIHEPSVAVHGLPPAVPGNQPVK